MNGLLGAAALETEGLLAMIAQEAAEVQEGKTKLGGLAAAHTSLAKLKNEMERRLERPKSVTHTHAAAQTEADTLMPHTYAYTCTNV